MKIFIVIGQKPKELVQQLTELPIFKIIEILIMSWLF